jgi:leucyl aminopeptidase
MTIELLQQDLLSVPCDLLVVNLFQGVVKPAGATGIVDKALDGAISSLIEQDEFAGKLGQSFVFPTFGKIKAKKVAVIGLGDKKSFDADAIRKVGGYVVKIAERAHAKKIVTILHGAGIGGVDPKMSAQSLVEGMQLSAYRFHLYHGRLRASEKEKSIKSITICETDVRAAKSAVEGIERGTVLAEATCFARDLVNHPSSHMSPADLVEAAKSLVGNGVTLKVMDEAEMQRKKMSAALAVARGSEHPPFGVHLSYKPRGAKKKIILVGKAVTFDSGGLSIKPADAMMTMKCDMGGAAAVLGAFKAIAALKPNVEVHGIFLAVENMPSGKAYRPGDVVTAMDGTTIEILNTDAEGRVTLADALSYAKTLEPDAIIDLATLTGACVVALGEEIAGVMTNDAKLGQRLLDASKEAGEPLWELPLFAPYMEHVKSKIADIKNIGARGQAGAISAAMFLKPFVGDTSWAHLDIAGPAYVEKETRPDIPYGGTGYGVRLLMKFLSRF